MEKVPNNSSENIKEGKNESGWDDLENYEVESADEQSADSSDSRESLLRTKEQMGKDSIIYSDTGPGDWSVDLPPQDEK